MLLAENRHELFYVPNILTLGMLKQVLVVKDILMFRFGMVGYCLKKKVKGFTTCFQSLSRDT